MRRLLPPTLFLLSLCAMAELHLAWPATVLVPSPWRWLGVVPVVVGLALAIAGSRHFARVGTNIKTFDAPNVLVTDGLFRHTRNPMYLGFVIALVGASLLFGSASPALVVAAFAIITDRWYIRFEERAMARTFGAAYAAYRRTTRRWI
jgi:protein-S-isoprenylcysteine O-methyltransferase Ste14